MTMALIFWVMMLLFFLSLFAGNFLGLGHYAPLISSGFIFVLFLLLGWKVFGRPIQDAWPIGVPSLQRAMVNAMSARETDESTLRRIETRISLLEQVITAQSESTRTLTSKVNEFEAAMAIVQEVQVDWQTQKAARAAWQQIMDFVRWVVVVLAAAVGAVAAYLGIHAGKP